MTTWGELEMKHDRYRAHLEEMLDFEGEDKEEYNKKVARDKKYTMQAQRALLRQLKDVAGKPNAKQKQIDNYEYLEWEEKPIKVYDDLTKHTYDEARTTIRNLDKEPKNWLTPFKGHGCANKTSGSKHIHKGGLQLWLKKFKGKQWAIFIGKEQTIEDLLGENASLDDPYITLESIMSEALAKASITEDMLKQTLCPVKLNNELAAKLEKVKSFNKENAISWLREFGAFKRPEPGSLSGATEPTPVPPTKKAACAMLIQMLVTEASFPDPDDDTVYWLPGLPLPTN